MRASNVTLDDFVDSIQDEAGAALRVVTWYAGGEFSELYLRDNLDWNAIVDRTQFLAGRQSDSEAIHEDGPLEDLGEELAIRSQRALSVRSSGRSGRRCGGRRPPGGHGYHMFL